MPRKRLFAFLMLILLLLSCFPVRPGRAAAALELFGTFESMGVIVEIDAADDPDEDMTAALAYRPSGGGSYQTGFPLSRISATRFVGSLFWLTPGTDYDVQVTLTDPDGGLLNGEVLSDTGATRANISLPTPTHTYYASPGGSGAGCTLAVPCALSQAVSQAQPGEEVRLKGGSYFVGDLSLPRSGSEGSPILFRSVPGETPVLDGADPADFTWTALGGGLWQTTINTPDPSLVTADGERLLSYASLSDLQNLVWDQPGFYVDGTTLTVHLDGGADPNPKAMAVSRFKQGFYIDKSFIVIQGLTFQHYGNNGGYGKAIYLNGASDNVIQSCTFGINDTDIGIKRLSHRNLIQDNDFYDDISDWIWDVFYSGDISIGAGAILFYADSTHGRGNVIRRNRFENMFDGAHLCPTSSGPETLELDFYDNVIRGMGDDGFETDGVCSNLRIWGNTISDALMAVSLAPAEVGPVYVIRNLIYETRTDVGTAGYTGSPFKFNQGGHSGPLFLINNTADAVNPNNNGLYIKEPGSWELIFSRNNIWSGTNYALNDYNTAHPLDMDYDNLWNAGANDLVRWENIRYATLAAFTAAQGHEAHGLNVLPGFVNLAVRDYHLTPTSLLIDAGVHIPGITDGFSGAAPDIGAFEFTAASTDVYIYLPQVVR